MASVRAALVLVRPHMTLLAFLSIFVPVFVRTRDVTISIGRAAPLLFVAMCTFLLNDLDDVERDKINHPERPLPRGEIAPTAVIILYYLSLALALFTIRLGVAETEAAFLYYVLLAVSISYGYVIEYLPTWKAPYVAGASTVPLLILIAFYPTEQTLYFMAVAFFLFNLGRELCGDVLDRAGDPLSQLHTIASERLAIVALAFQVGALLLTGLQVETVADAIVFTFIVTLIALGGYLWFVRRRYNNTLTAMKLAIYLGLYYLV